MSLIPQTIDLSVQLSGTFDPQLARTSGAVLLVNFSAFDLTITPPDNNAYTVPANCIRNKHYIGGYASGIWTWKKLQTAPVVSTPSSLVVESYSDGVEPIPPEYIIPLTRGATVGAAVGINGSAVIVAQALRVPVTVTSAVTLLTYAVPVNGTYRVTFSIQQHNGSSFKPRVQANFIDADGVADFINPLGQDNVGNGHVYDGVGVTLSGGDYMLNVTDAVFEANVGTMTCVYQTTGTPNDQATVVVEHLA